MFSPTRFGPRSIWTESIVRAVSLKVISSTGLAAAKSHKHRVTFLSSKQSVVLGPGKTVKLEGRLSAAGLKLRKRRGHVKVLIASAR